MSVLLLYGLVALAVAMMTCFVVRRVLKRRHPILQAPVAECSRDEGSLVIRNSTYLPKALAAGTVFPVEQTSFDEGELVVSTAR